MSSPEKKDELTFFKRLPWEKMVTWGACLGLIFTLRNLFPVFFITFVISYICRNVVKFFNAPFGERWYIRKMIVIVTFAMLLMVFYLGGRFLVPNVIEQGRQIVTLIYGLKLHEDVDNALPNLYSNLRFWFYKDGDDYQREFQEFRESEDPVKINFEGFKADAQRFRDQFRENMILRYGNAAYQENLDSPAYREELETRTDEYIESKYKQNKARLEAAKEEELLKDRYAYDYWKKKYGATEEAWSEYLRDEIMIDLRKAVHGNPAEKAEYEATLKEIYVQREGRKAVELLEKTPEWEADFKAYYDSIYDEDLHYPYEDFVRLEGAKSQREYLEIVGDESKMKSNLTQVFRQNKEKEFAETFMGYGFVEELNSKMKQDFLPGVARWMASTIEYTVTLAFHLILSVFLSFFIVWDIPRLKTLLKRLGTSRMQDFYHEVGPGLASFGSLMGRAFQAQALIAAVNTTLTCSAMYILDVPHKTFLCCIVFICSFIPVVGVIISSIPMVVVALPLPDGFIVALELVGCVLLIHFIETTLLNPKIMGDMLKLHPLLVLVILLVGEHFFGVWGLLLGVPVTVYIFRFVILKAPEGIDGGMIISSVEIPPEESPEAS
ncbi:MAG: AI-2E family transporter [Planctomycetes bacterium]|nr:AI-2E family transporter [Planctomycetota bacterium]